MTRTYTPPPWNARAEAAYQSAPRTLPLSQPAPVPPLLSEQHPEKVRIVLAASAPRALTTAIRPATPSAVPRTDPGSTRGRIRAVVGAKPNATRDEIYKTIYAGVCPVTRRAVSDALSNLVTTHQLSREGKPPHERYTLTTLGQNLLEGRV